MSALILRSPWTISLIRLAGTEIDRASWVLTESQRLEEFREEDPARVHGRHDHVALHLLLLVVVNDLDINASR